MSHKKKETWKKGPYPVLPVTAKALAICTVFGRSPHPRESLNCGPGPGGICLLLSLLVMPLLDCLPSILYSAPAAASSQSDGSYQRLPALFWYNREVVRRGFLHHLSYVHVEKSSPKLYTRQLEKGLCRPEEFLKWKVIFSCFVDF